MQTLFVNTTPDQVARVLAVSQNDVGRQFLIKLVNEEGGYNVPSGSTVKIRATKPSGLGFDVAVTSITADGLLFTATAEMTDEAGRFPAEIRIEKDGNILGTSDFMMWVERNPHPDGTTDGMAENIVPMLTALINEVTDAANTATDTAAAAQNTAAAAQASADTALTKANEAAGAIEDAYDTMEGYVEDAKTYRDEAFHTTPEGYETLVAEVGALSEDDANKNVLPQGTSRTASGVTFTVNSDGSVTANGTAAEGGAVFAYATNVSIPPGTYILNGNPTGTSSTTYRMRYRKNDGSWNYFNTTGDSSPIEISNGDTFSLAVLVVTAQTVTDLTFYPMLRKASITDPTYVPYSNRNDALVAVASALSDANANKNLLPRNGMTVDKTTNGVIYTANADGSITANGEATSTQTTYDVGVAHLSAGTYVITGTPSTGTSTTYFMRLGIGGYADTLLGLETGTGYTATIEEDVDIYVRVYVRQNAGTVSNLTFYPMIRPVAITDPTYVPYNKSNDALRNEVDELTQLATTPRPISNGGTGATTVIDAANNLQVQSLGQGTAIAANTDLNDITTVGNYYCSTDANSKTLLHPPVAQSSMRAFIMRVGYALGAGYRYQEIILHSTGNRYYRYTDNPSDPSRWKAWFVFESNSTISAMSQSEATTGTETAVRSISAKVLNDTIAEKTSGLLALLVDYVKVQNVSATISRAASSSVSVTAPTISGYKFSHWANISTSGWVGAVYAQDGTSQSTNFWVAATTNSSGSGYVVATAVYIRDIT